VAVILDRDGQEKPVGKILAVGRNYAAHAAEMHAPAEPVVFMKPGTAIRLPGEPVSLPRERGEVHHEIEIAIWLRTGGTGLTREAAGRCIGAYGLVLDLTLRDVQAEAKRAGRPWTLAKGFDASLPTGVFVSAGSVAEPEGLEFTWSVAGELRQAGRARDMLLAPAALLAFISSWITLEPGDLVLTGTPEGVGPVVPGDRGVMNLAGWNETEVVFV